MVIFTTIITPILLKIVFGKKKPQDYSGLVESELVDSYEEISQIDLADQEILKLNEELKVKKQTTRH
jgi:hypothetical protein